MNTDNIVAHSRARFDHAAAKRVLREKYQAKLIFAYNGGMWQAGPELITLLTGRTKVDIVLLDMYQNPVQVNATQFLKEVDQRWQEQMNAWLVEYEELNKNR